MAKKFSAFFHQHFFDCLIAAVLVVSSCGLMAYYLWPRKSEDLYASIYHRDDCLRDDINLSSYGDEVEHLYFYVKEGETDHTDITVGVKHNAIAIVKSGCPSQYCVSEGFISDPSRSIICAYNEFYIFLKGISSTDVVAG